MTAPARASAGSADRTQSVVRSRRPTKPRARAARRSSRRARGAAAAAWRPRSRRPPRGGVQEGYAVDRAGDGASHAATRSGSRGEPGSCTSARECVPQARGYARPRGRVPVPKAPSATTAERRVGEAEAMRRSTRPRGPRRRNVGTSTRELPAAREPEARRARPRRCGGCSGPGSLQQRDERRRADAVETREADHPADTRGETNADQLEAPRVGELVEPGSSTSARRTAPPSPPRKILRDDERLELPGAKRRGRRAGVGRPRHDRRARRPRARTRGAQARPGRAPRDGRETLERGTSGRPRRRGRPPIEPSASSGPSMRP